MRSIVQEVEIGPFSIDLGTCRVIRDGVELVLRPQAFRALKTLIQNRGQYVDYDGMIAEAWDGTFVSKHTVDVTVGEVRKSLREFGAWIIHRPKLGYRLDVPKSEELVKRGWHFWTRRTREGFEKAVTCFQEAALEDGTDFRAYEGLAVSYLMLASHGMRLPLEMYELFLEMHGRAVALGGLTAELRTYRAHGLHVIEKKFSEAESEFLKAKREKPTLTTVYAHLALLYVAEGRFDDALNILSQGDKIDPLWPSLPAVEIAVRFFGRDFEGAVECGKKAIELHPFIPVGRGYYGQALEHSGRIDEALNQYRHACIMSPGLFWPRALEARCLAKNRRSSEAREILAELELKRATDYVDAYFVALLHEALGQRDRVFQELERAREENSITLCLINVDPKMDPLRQDPRFERLRKHLFGRNGKGH